MENKCKTQIITCFVSYFLLCMYILNKLMLYFILKWNFSVIEKKDNP